MSGACGMGCPGVPQYYRPCSLTSVSDTSPAVPDPPGAPKKALNVLIRADLKLRLRTWATEHGMSDAAAVAYLITEALNRQERGEQ